MQILLDYSVYVIHLVSLLIELLGYVPEDSQVPQYDIERRPLVTLAGSSPAAAAADRIAARLFS